MSTVVSPSATLLTEQQHDLQAAVRDPVSGYGRVLQGRRRQRRWPGGALSGAGANGFLGVHIPEEYGGGGGLTDLAVVIEEIAAQSCPLFFPIISSTIAVSIPAGHGTPYVKQRYLPSARPVLVDIADFVDAQR